MLALFTVLMVSAGVSSVRALGSIVGVQVGNNFTYKVNYASSSSSMYGIDTFTETVTAVNMTMGYHVVWYNEIVHFNDGSAKANSGGQALETGYWMGTGLAQEGLFYSANLQVGDRLTSTSSVYINETVLVNGRPTNHASANIHYLYQNITVAGTIEYYLDQATGVVVNGTEYMTFTGQPTTSESFSLIATNVWNVIPEFSPIALTLTMLLLTTGATIMVYRRKKQPSSTASTKVELNQ
jgi:hypothetical protein